MNDSPVWSPSGRFMLYNHYGQNADGAESLGTYQIWQLDLTTGVTRYVASGMQAHWLGTDFAFTYLNGSAGGVYIYALVTSQATPLHACGDMNLDAQTAPDGRTVALVSNCPATNGSGIILEDRVTGDTRSVPAKFGGVSRQPAWSPDGARLAVVHYFSTSGLMNLCVIDTSGNLVQRLNDDETTEDGEPTWSRDGTWIYWNRYGTNGHQSQMGIWRVHPDGTGKEMLIHDGWYPSLAPGDTALAFAKFDSLNTLDLWISDKDGAHQRRLFPAPDSSAMAGAPQPADWRTRFMGSSGGHIAPMR